MTDVDHKQYIGQRFHVLDATETALQLFQLATQLNTFALVVMTEGTVSHHFLKVLQTLDGLTDGLEIGEHAAQPTMTDVRHPATLSFSLHSFASRTLGANKQYLAAISHGVTNKIRSRIEQGQRFFKVNDMNTIALTKDIGSHLGVPETGLMSEMNTRFQHLSHRHAGHSHILRIVGVRPPRTPYDNPKIQSPPLITMD